MDVGQGELTSSTAFLRRLPLTPPASTASLASPHWDGGPALSPPSREQHLHSTHSMLSAAAAAAAVLDSNGGGGGGGGSSAVWRPLVKAGEQPSAAMWRPVTRTSAALPRFSSSSVRHMQAAAPGAASPGGVPAAATNSFVLASTMPATAAAVGALSKDLWPQHQASLAPSSSMRRAGTAAAAAGAGAGALPSASAPGAWWNASKGSGGGHEGGAERHSTGYVQGGPVVTPPAV